jgi:hypothetical protein
VGRKVVWFQTAFGCTAIVCLHEVIAQGHLEEGLIRKGASTQTQRFPRLEGKVSSTIRPTPGSQKGLRLIIERYHQGLKESFGFKIRDP